LLGLALETMLAIASYALAEQVQAGKKIRMFLLSTILFAGFSVSANVAYFMQHPGPGGDNLAWLWGFIAPAVALANGILGGAVAGVEKEAEDVKESNRHEEEMGRITVATLKSETALVKAKSRPLITAPQAVTPAHEESTKLEYADFKRAYDAGEFKNVELTGAYVAGWAMIHESS